MAKILVVDDAGVDRRIAGEFIEQAGSTACYAEDGAQAMEQIRLEKPDAVLTDLQMPTMDGLELVQQIRRSYPGTPVILMTAFGSELIAVEALHAGAASYVPKQNLGQDLGEALRIVLATVAARHEPPQVRQLLTQQTSQFVLGYEAGSQAALVNHLQNDLARVEFTDDGMLMQIGMALAEAITNAVDHGNLELDSALRDESNDAYRDLGNQRATEPPYCDRRVYVTEHLTQNEATFVIRDDGSGFDPTTLPDPTDPENLLKPSGRGIMLMRTFMDDLHFGPQANEITLVKRRSHSS